MMFVMDWSLDQEVQHQCLLPIDRSHQRQDRHNQSHPSIDIVDADVDRMGVDPFPSPIEGPEIFKMEEAEGVISTLNYESLGLVVLTFVSWLQNLKRKFRDMNDDSVVKEGVSNVFFVRGSVPGGRRTDGVGRVVRDMVSYWLNGRWPAVVYVGGG